MVLGSAPVVVIGRRGESAISDHPVLIPTS
jgi:hypothetical protein